MRRRGQVLLIEDQSLLRDVLKKNLEEDGFYVWEAMDGQQGLDLLKEGCLPDIVISDVVMPRKNGIEVFAEIKALYPSIKLVAMSGCGGGIKGISPLDHALAIGVDAVLQKPFDMVMLEETMHRLVE